MSRSTKVWIVLLALFVIANFAGMGYAAQHSQWVHTCAHIVLALAGEYAIWRLLRRRTAGV